MRVTRLEDTYEVGVANTMTKLMKGPTFIGALPHTADLKAAACPWNPELLLQVLHTQLHGVWTSTNAN